MYEFMHAGSAKPPDRAVTASACPSNRVARRLREGRFWVDSSGLGGSSVPPFRLRRGHNVAVIWLNATVGAGKSVVGRALATFCLLSVEVMNNDHWFLPSSRSVGPSLSFIACHTYIEAMLRYGLHSSAFSCTILVDAISMRP